MLSYLWDYPMLSKETQNLLMTAAEIITLNPKSSITVMLLSSLHTLFSWLYVCLGWSWVIMGTGYWIRTLTGQLPASLMNRQLSSMSLSTLCTHLYHSLPSHTPVYPLVPHCTHAHPSVPCIPQKRRGQKCKLWSNHKKYRNKIVILNNNRLTSCSNMLKLWFSS